MGAGGPAAPIIDPTPAPGAPVIFPSIVLPIAPAPTPGALGIPDGTGYGVLGIPNTGGGM
jgi:hypothetical protein